MSVFGLTHRERHLRWLESGGKTTTTRRLIVWVHQNPALMETLVAYQLNLRP